VALARALSKNRRGISWRPVIWGLGLQLVLGAIVLTPALQDVFFTVVDGGVRRLLSFAEAGSDFVFQSVQAHQIDVITDDGVTTMTVAGHISPPLRTVVGVFLG
jgi:concentrative nucleoside transporter, CNT family